MGLIATRANDPIKAAINENTRIALKLCLVTAQRRAEVSGMRRSEIEDGWWTLPAERSKNGRAHRVPLSPLAKELINKASGDDFLFPSPLKNQAIQPSTLTNAVTKNRHCFDTERFSTHDLRRTAATRMAEIGISRFDIAKVLNHTDQEVTAIYDRWAYDAEKKKALLKWARRLQNILDEKVTDKVVKIS